MRTFLSRLLLALAALAALLPPLIALQLAQPLLGLQRFREPSLAVYGLLALALLAAPSPRRALATGIARGRDVLDSPRFFPVAAAALAALYVASVAGQHLAFRTFSHDFAMLDEAITPLPGRPLLYTPVLGRSFLSEHFSPVLLALVPLRALVPSPYVLLFAQAGALWGAAMVLRRVLRADGHPRWLANLAFVLWLNHPTVVSTLQYAAHMESFLPLVVLGAFLADRRGRPVAALLLLAVALLVKEDVGLYVAGYGAWRAVAGPGPVRRRIPAGATLAVVGVGWTLFALRVAIPHFAPPDEGFRFLDRWEAWGSGPGGVVVGWVTHPMTVIEELLGRAPIRLFGAMLFLPFFPRAGVLLFAVPWILNVTSGDRQQAGLSLYYGIPVVAFATLAAVEGMRTEAFARLARSRWAVAAVAAAVILNVAHFRFPPVARHRADIVAAVERIPDGATVQTMSCFYPVVGPRRERRLVEAGDVIDAPWAIVRTRSTTWPLSGAQAEAALARALADGYDVVAEADGAWVLRAPDSAPE